MKACQNESSRFCCLLLVRGKKKRERGGDAPSLSSPLSSSLLLRLHHRVPLDHVADPKLNAQPVVRVAVLGVQVLHQRPALGEGALQTTLAAVVLAVGDEVLAHLLHARGQAGDLGLRGARVGGRALEAGDARQVDVLLVAVRGAVVFEEGAAREVSGAFVDAAAAVVGAALSC